LLNLERDSPSKADNPPGDPIAPNKETAMKPLLALVTLALTVLIFEEKARQVAGDTHAAIDNAVVQAREARQALSQKVARQPLISVLFAGGLAYALATIIPARE
jgi:hypothetical protein